MWRPSAAANLMAARAKAFVVMDGRRSESAFSANAVVLCTNCEVAMKVAPVRAVSVTCSPVTDVFCGMRRGNATRTTRPLNP